MTFLSAVREKFVHKMGKFVDWLMNRKTENKSAGRPTIGDPLLTVNRNSLIDMLSCWWEEVGWQLPRATTRNELSAALEPLKEHPNRHLISRLLLPTSDTATAEQVREKRQAHREAIARIYESEARRRECTDSVTQAEMAVGQASKEQKEAVEAQLSKRQTELQAANNAHEAARVAQQAIEKKLDQMEAAFAQDELLMFIDKRFIKGKYARNPRNLADAMAGLPYTQGVHFLGAWQSYARCSKLHCLPHNRFQVFETIQRICKKSPISTMPPVDFFHQQIMALPRTVVVETLDPISQTQVRQESQNFVRSYLLDNWPIWSLAIKKSFESPVERGQMAFVIGSNFTKIQRDPKTSIALVLGSTEKV